MKECSSFPLLEMAKKFLLILPWWGVNMIWLNKSFTSCQSRIVKLHWNNKQGPLNVCLSFLLWEIHSICTWMHIHYLWKKLVCKNWLVLVAQLQVDKEEKGHRICTVVCIIARAYSSMFHYQGLHHQGRHMWIQQGPQNSASTGDYSYYHHMD